MAYNNGHGVRNGVIVGAIAGFLLSFRLVQIAVLAGIAYLCGLFLYDRLVTQAEAAPSSWSMSVVGEETPDFHFSRQDPKWTVHVQMTNRGDIKILKWILRGKLFQCPRAFAPIDTCTKVGETAGWVTDIVRPNETVTSNQDVVFWDNDDTVGQLRVLWSAENVITDNDTDVDADQREMARQLEHFNNL